MRSDNTVTLAVVVVDKVYSVFFLSFFLGGEGVDTVGAIVQRPPGCFVCLYVRSKM